MKIPTRWLAEHLELPHDLTTGVFPQALIDLGHEVTDVVELEEITGPLVIGRVSSIEELTEFAKPIRYCQVEVSDDGDELGIICGARNFAEGELVVVALPGAVLPGGFAIGSRKTYGRVSEGMICSVRELGIGSDHDGILVLPAGFAEAGDDAVELLGLTDTVLDLEITPDRGYALSVRGLSRELSCALDVPFGDPAGLAVFQADGQAWPVTLQEQAQCQRFAAIRITGLDATAPTPWWMRRRLMLSGVRSIALAVDVTNYVMLEVGQPLHAYDAGKLTGAITVRRAVEGERLRTLDGVVRELDPDDVCVCDESGPIGLAGVMGGASTEIDEDSSDVLLEAAVWDPASVARTARRHKLPSEASRRFERGVDNQLPPAALELCAQLLARLGDSQTERGRTDVGDPHRPDPIGMQMDLPDRTAGVWYKRGVTAGHLTKIGCAIEVSTSDNGRPFVTAVPPSWRPDLRQPVDLVEEVLRLEGYNTIPSTLPAAPVGRGLSAGQRRRRAVSRALAEDGYTEVRPFPFVSPGVWDRLGLPEQDSRRNTVELLNPLDAQANALATTLVPGMLEVASRNLSRGNRDLALYAIGQVSIPMPEQAPVPQVGVAGRPSAEQLALLDAALPDQPIHVAVLMTGLAERAGWWGDGRQACWSDAVAAAHRVAAAAGETLHVRAAQHAPWHPGRCAELLIGELPIGHAGELHPKVVEEFGLPKRSVAMELNLDGIPLPEDLPAPTVSGYPPAVQDVALVVDTTVPAGEVAAQLRAGAGELLEHLALFDVYTGEQVGEGKRSLAYTLRFRADDRTLTSAEATAARDAAVAAVRKRFGATLRS